MHEMFITNGTAFSRSRTRYPSWRVPYCLRSSMDGFSVKYREGVTATGLGILEGRYQVNLVIEDVAQWL
jgi:hypothetical protein